MVSVRKEAISRSANRTVFEVRSLACFLAMLLVVLSHLGFTTLSHADEPQLLLAVSPKQGSIDDVFTLNVIVEGLGTEGFPVLQGGNDFRLTLNGSQVEMVSGAHEPRFRTVYRYQMFPKRTGVLDTPSAELRRGALHLTAPSQKLKVVPSSSKVAARSEDVFVLQSLGSEEVFVGQQAGLMIELFSKREVYRPQFVDLTLDNFIVQNLPQEEAFERSIEGSRYQVLRARKALYPLREGNLSLPSVDMKVSVMIQRRVKMPAFGGFFNFESIERVPEERVLQSNPLTLKVSPLPPLPRDFSNWGQKAPLVGITDIRGSLDRELLRTGETATLTVTLASTGNILGIKELPLTSTESLRIYHEQTEEQTREYLGQLITTKRFAVSIVPLLPGRHKIPTLALDFFDPESRSYRKAVLEPMVLNAHGRPLVAEVTSAETQTGGSENSFSNNMSASSVAGADANSRAPLLRSPTVIDRLWSIVSPATLLMACFGLAALILFIWRIVQPKPEGSQWTGPTDLLVPAFLKAASACAGVEWSEGDEIPFEALRNALRKSTLLERAVIFELCAVLDKLERLGITELDEASHPEEPSKEIKLGNISEGLIKRMEALVPALRSPAPS